MAACRMLLSEKNEQKVQLVKDEGKIDCLMGEDRGLFFKNLLCVLNVQELKKKLMFESHNIIFIMYSEGNKMYQDLK